MRGLSLIFRRFRGKRSENKTAKMARNLWLKSVRLVIRIILKIKAAKVVFSRAEAHLIDEQGSKNAAFAAFNSKLEPLAGFEPVTCSLRMSCSTS